MNSCPAALTTLSYYHAFLGLLGPDEVKGQRPTQEGTLIKVTGEGGGDFGQIVNRPGDDQRQLAIVRARALFVARLGTETKRCLTNRHRRD